MQFNARPAGRISIPEDQRVVLEHARLRGEDYSHRKFKQFATIGSRLEGCHLDGALIENAQFGSGREPSEFIECSFDRARMNMGPGGYARFVRCSFREVELHNWICHEVELIDCIFSGRLRKGVFNGAVRTEKRMLLGRNRNEFHGNDFSAMDLIDVGFRTGIDLTMQRLPSGAGYLYLADAPTSVESARSTLINLNEPELRRVAMTMIESLEEDIRGGQRQLLLRADNYYSHSAFPREAVEKVFALLQGQLDKL